MPKPRWPPASGPSTMMKSGKRSSFWFLRRKICRARTDETMMPSLASRKRGWSAIRPKELKCRPADRVMPSMPASSAAFRRTRSVSRGPFIVSFSMQFTKIRPGPFFASIVRPICRRCASARRPRSNCTTALSIFLMLNLSSLFLSLTKVVSKRRSDTSSTIASEIWPMPPRRAASSASSDVEMSTPMPPIMMGTYSLSPNRRRKSSTRFIAILRLLGARPAWRQTTKTGVASVPGYLNQSRTSMQSIAEVVELQRGVGHFLAQQRHRHLQIVALGAGDAHRFALDAGLHLHLALLDDLRDLLGGVRVEAVLDLDDLLDLVAADFLDLAFVEEAHVDLALGQLVGQHVADLAELEIGIGKRRQFVFLLLDARIAALEVETRGDFLVGLVDGIAHFDHVGFGNYVKRWHILFSFQLFIPGSRGAWAARAKMRHFNGYRCERSVVFVPFPL